MSAHPNKRIVHEELMSRKASQVEANTIILHKLTEYLRANPTKRFVEALVDLNIIGYSSADYHRRSETTLQKMK